MDQRGQFTFYASIFESARRIRNKSARADFYDAICDFALNGIEPNLDKLSDGGAIGFISARPNLEASRKKAKSGKAGGTAKQTPSKRQANAKQTESEKEKENEKENEIEKEIEKENECYLSDDDGDDLRAQASESELNSIGLVPGVYPMVSKNVVKRTKEISHQLMPGTEIGPGLYRNVFMRLIFVDGEETTNSRELLKYAFESAAAAGHNGEWWYINGIMDKLASRGITTAKEAILYDAERPDKEADYADRD